jgi:DNA-binding transcriptional MocR family regulator
MAIDEMTMSDDKAAAFWTPAISKAASPVYLAIADALSADILSGRLTGGTRLPPQRTLADTLGIDFTTVSRAYAEARRRGLIEGKVGQGTYVRFKRPISVGSTSNGLIDMSMNLPPRFNDPGVVARMWDGIGSLEADAGLDLLLRYQAAGGTSRDRAAGAQWLSSRLEAVNPDHVLICSGAQGALLTVTAALAAPGETVCVEALTYPGFLPLAAHLRLNLVGVPIDNEGLLPDAFDAACVEHKPKALYCTPTLHNPTTATLSLERREALLSIARRHQVPIIEDDAYGALPENRTPPLAALAPELVYHIASLSKCLAPALRIAYLVAPDLRTAARLAGGIRATAAMVSPLAASIATRWIEDGTAEAVLKAIRAETKARQSIAKRILPGDKVIADPEGFHAWLQLTPPWTRGEFVARLRSAGIGAVASDAFAVTTPPEAVRLGLGAPATQAELIQSLEIVADLLATSPASAMMVV